VSRTTRKTKDQKNSDSTSRGLFWEPVADLRWGKYISSIERHAIDFALSKTEVASLALEVGAEGGRWSKLLSDQGWRVTCTDINEDALKVCQNRIPSANCILVDKHATHFPCETDCLGMLLAIEVHELVEQKWFVLEASRTLKAHGLFVGVFQNKSSWRALVKNSLHEENDKLTHYTASYAPWRNQMRAQGFEMLLEMGICWMPFGRKSNSMLIPLAVRVEKWIGLRRLPSFSPWIVFVARKTSDR